MRHASKLFSVSLVLLLAACAARKIEMPSYEGRAFDEVLSERGVVTDINTRFSILFEKNETEIRGDAALDISRAGDMSLRVYSLGFLAMELTSKDGAVRSDPALDRAKKMILTRGLRDCLFWWDVRDFDLLDEKGSLLLKSAGREIWIDKKTFLPSRQTIYFEDGKELNIYYSEPANENDVWYQSKIRIELAKYVVTLKIKSMSFKT